MGDITNIEGRYEELKKKFDLMESFLAHKGLGDEFDSFARISNGEGESPKNAKMTAKAKPAVDPVQKQVKTKKGRNPQLNTNKKGSADVSSSLSYEEEEEAKQEEVEESKKKKFKAVHNNAVAVAVDGNNVEVLPSTLKELEQRSSYTRTKQTAKKPFAPGETSHYNRGLRPARKQFAKKPNRPLN